MLVSRHNPTTAGIRPHPRGGLGGPGHRSRRRAGALAAAGFAAAVAATSALFPHGASAVAVIGASCYDAYYFDGLTTRYSASHCSGASSGKGYAATAFDNTTARTGTQRNAQDGVFFFAGHALVFTSSGAAGATLVYESPNSSGNLDGLASTPLNTALSQFLLVQICTAGGGCRSQTDFVTYPYVPEKLNLVVAEGCNTAQNGSVGSTFVPGFAGGAFNYGAGTAIGFYNEILFPVGADETGQYGDGWANTFWSDLAVGDDYTTAMVDAANSVGNAGGLGSYVEYHHSGAPTTLGPAQFYKP